MTKRLQVLLEESELREVQRAARRGKMTVAEWVRQVLRAARRGEPRRDPQRKLAVVRAGSRHRFPTADVDRMLADIESGYTSGARSS